MSANSAIAANTSVRSLAGGGLPLFATAMYHTLGVAWATSLLGFLCRMHTSTDTVLHLREADQGYGQVRTKYVRNKDMHVTFERFSSIFRRRRVEIIYSE